MIPVLVCCFGCDSSTPDSGLENSPTRGDIVQVELRQVYTIRELDQLASELGVLYTPRFDVALYVMEYFTVDIRGEITVASGAIAVPQPFSGTLPIVSYQHGTTVQHSDAPSSGTLESNLVGLLFSAEGYLSVMPDLIGLGSSTDFHPYLIADISVTAVVDMMRAVTGWSEAQSWNASSEVYLVGYSSGGYTAMATHKAIEAEYSDEFTVNASAPMAGPYNLSGTMLDLMIREEPYPQPYFFAYLLLSYNEAYELYSNPSDFLISPYDMTLPPLFDGAHSGSEINDAMPPIPVQIIQPDVVQAVKDNPDHPFLLRLRENNLINWTPRSPVQLYHCAADEVVPIENSQLAAQELGSLATFIDPSPQSGHIRCAFVAIASARAWFNSIATQDLGQ